MICFCVTSAGASQYAIRLTISEQEIQSTIDGHCNAFEYTGAIPKSIVTDNQKTAVICNHCCHIELSLFNSFENMPEIEKTKLICTRNRVMNGHPTRENLLDWRL